MLKKEFKRTYNLPFKHLIPNYTAAFLKQKHLIFRWFKFAKRYFYIILKKQKSLEIYEILNNHKNILWINLSAISFGDSLMDLSGRVLLSNKNIDLYTHSKNAPLYRSDHIFNNIFINIDELVNVNYDLVIIDSYSTRSMKIKAKVVPDVSFVGVYGFFNGPEVNRVLFSFHQINNLLGYLKSADEINKLAISSISISNNDKFSILDLKLPKNYIAIAIGGEWLNRTYNRWIEVIQGLLEYDPSLNIVILGSSNGKEVAKKIIKMFPSEIVFDCVNKFSFCQTTEIIKRSSILICCDGGLMHAANASKKTMIVLLARLTSEMQLTPLSKYFALYDKDNVNNISASRVINKYKEVINLSES